MKNKLFILVFLLELIVLHAFNQKYLTGSDSLKVIESGQGRYIIKKDSVFYELARQPWSSSLFPKIVSIECDLVTFNVIKNGYAKDRNNIYYNGIKINNVDYNSFKIIEPSNLNSDPYWDWIKAYYSKDNYHVFIGDKIILNADVYSFVLIEGRFTKDHNHVYHVGKAISDNPESFQILDYKSRYAKDKEYAFYWWGVGSPEELDTIKVINPERFKVLTDSRASDGENIYWHGQLLPNADIETFKVINNDYSCDNNHVYFKNKLIREAKPETFKFLDKYYSKDDKAVYYFDSIIMYADPASFIPLSYRWGKDKDYIYFEYNRRKDIDYESFELDSLFAFAKDKFYIYDSFGKIFKKNTGE
jgi:hypothetical protein